MKITVKSSFDPNVREVETKSATLGALFEELSGNYGLVVSQFFNTYNREIYSDCLVLVNGQSYQYLIDGLDTKLNDGDKVEIQLMIAGGG